MNTFLAISLLSITSLTAASTPTSPNTNTPNLVPVTLLFSSLIAANHTSHVIVNDAISCPTTELRQNFSPIKQKQPQQKFPTSKQGKNSNVRHK